MGSIGDAWTTEVEFQNRQTNISLSNIGITGTAGSGNTLYMYTGWGTFTSTSNFTYNGSSKTKLSTTGSHGSTYNISWDGKASLAGSSTLSIQTPALPQVSFTMDSANISESISNDTYCSFYIVISPSDYSNDTNLLYKSDTTIFILTIHVINPSYNDYNYPIYFYDGSTLLGSLTYTIRSRSFEFNYYPESINRSNYQNADSMFPQSIVKPGYRSLGWDTSSSATTVVYGGRAVSYLYIPANTVPYSSGFCLYSVWEKVESVLIYVNGERRAVTRMDVVTNVNPNNNAITTHTVRNGKIYDGNSWKEVSL